MAGISQCRAHQDRQERRNNYQTCFRWRLDICHEQQVPGRIKDLNRYQKIGEKRGALGIVSRSTFEIPERTVVVSKLAYMKQILKQQGLKMQNIHDDYGV